MRDYPLNLILIGNLAGELRHFKCSTETFINLKTQLVPMWEKQRRIWEEVIERLPVQKYQYSIHTDHFEKKNYPITMLKDQQMEEWSGLKKSLMPLPNTVMMYPMLRYVLTYLNFSFLFHFFPVRIGF